jgi:hypothetical protein
MSIQNDKIIDHKPINISPLMPQHPCRICLCGSSGTGKTKFLLDQLILSKDSPWNMVIFCAPKFSLEQAKVQEAYKKLGPKRMTLVEGIDEGKISEILDSQHSQGKQTLIVFDDLMNKKSKFITDLFISGRHRNASIAELSQRIFTDGKRTNRLNTDYYVIFNFSDKLEMKNLASQLYPKDYKEVMQLYEDATQDMHGCLIVDTKWKAIKSPDNKKLRFRKNKLDQIYEVDFK